jgi:error-prone DNA polymerase
LVWSGAAKRYVDITEQHRKQLNHELNLINKLKLAPYFLIMWDIVRYARSNGIAVQGRGSAANSAVCYCLMITAVDPIGMDLLFERFLSEGRHEPPDIDLDIAHQERERVLQYVYEKYGRAHAAMVCEVITYRGRSATRDAARVLGFSQEQADLLSREASHSEAYDAAARSWQMVALERLGFDINDHRVKMLIKVIAGLHQLPRHRSIHVGGFVLSGQPIGEIVPVESAAMEKRTVIQWDKDDIDLVGLIKIDLLGLGMLTMIQEGLRLVSQHRGLDIDIGRLDMADEQIYKMLQKADTVGCISSRVAGANEYFAQAQARLLLRYYCLDCYCAAWTYSGQYYSSLSSKTAG